MSIITGVSRARCRYSLNRRVYYITVAEKLLNIIENLNLKVKLETADMELAA